MTDLPFTTRVGYLWAAEPDAPEPMHVVKDETFADTWSDAWVSIGLTDPRYCSVDGETMHLALGSITVGPQPIPPRGEYAGTKLGWESEDRRWRMLATVRSMVTPSYRHPQGDPAYPVWPVDAVLEGDVRTYHAGPMDSEPEQPPAVQCRATFDEGDRGYECKREPGHEPPHRETIEHLADGGGGQVRHRVVERLGQRRSEWQAVGVTGMSEPITLEQVIEAFQRYTAEPIPVRLRVAEDLVPMLTKHFGPGVPHPALSALLSIPVYIDPELSGTDWSLVYSDGSEKGPDSPLSEPDNG